MKYAKFIILVSVILLISTTDILAAISGPVSAPLDGGLLSILGAAGISYYAMRKKKRNARND